MMQDPMADLSGQPAELGELTDSSKQIFDPLAMQMNLQRIDRIRSVMGIASGCVAGITGLTGLQGLFCCVLLHLAVCLAIWATKMNFDLAAYTKQSWFGYLTTGLESMAMSFMLFWTFLYGLVYLY